MGSTDERNRLAESISTLEKELKEAQRELTKAEHNRLRAMDIETQWHAEVTSLQKLIEVRQKRLNPEAPNEGAPLATQERRGTEAGAGGEVLAVSSDGDEAHEASDTVNRVQWINAAVVASGTVGITPPEILRQASKVNLKMHKNYPYIVLHKLVEREKVVKRRGRYYKKDA
jgi:chromosome segregation ATPase